LLILTDEQNAAFQTLANCLRKGGIAHLIGPYGSGKTHLARRVWETLEQEGLRVYGFVADHDINHLINRIRTAIEAAGNHPLAIIIDEWETAVIGTRIRASSRAAFQVLLRDIVFRRPGGGLLLCSASSVADESSVLPEAVLARMITVRLGTILRRPDPSNPGKSLVENLTENRMRIHVEQENATRSDENFLKVFQASAENIYNLICRPTERNLLARQIALLACDQQLPGSDKVSAVLESCGLALRRGQAWVVASWLEEILKGAGLLIASPHARDYLQVVGIVETSLLALAWEHYLRELAASRRWLREEAEAAGLDLFAGDEQLPRLVARIGQSPKVFVASLFRPSDVRELIQDKGSGTDKEQILENEFSRWCAEVHQ
jgi:hypothetical protein